MKKVETIWVIDDDEIHQFFAKKSIQHLEICNQILTFYDGIEAMANFKKLSAQNAALPDIIFLDINMPRMDGWEFMDELSKTKKVMSKISPNAPHEVLLVLDAITGQNALKQAQEFNKALQLTGIIFTKCDGSAKAGSAVGIVDQLRVPITYIGVGESVDDLMTFDLDVYLKTLVGLETT